MPEVLNAEADQEPKKFRDLSIESQLVVTRLKTIQVGEVVPYDEITALMSLDCRGPRGRSRVHTALRRLQIDHNMEFTAVRGVGYKRLDGSGTIDKARGFRQKAHRSAGRGLKSLRTVVAERLDNAERIRLNTEVSMLGVVKQFTAEKATKRIAVQVTQAQQQLPVAKTLAAFMSNGTG